MRTTNKTSGCCGAVLEKHHKHLGPGLPLADTDVLLIVMPCIHPRSPQRSQQRAEPKMSALEIM